MNNTSTGLQEATRAIPRLWCEVWQIHVKCCRLETCQHYPCDDHQHNIPEIANRIEEMVNRYLKNKTEV